MFLPKEKNTTRKVIYFSEMNLGQVTQTKCFIEFESSLIDIVNLSASEVV